MSEAEEKFYEELDGTVAFLRVECGLEKVRAEKLMNELLAAHTTMLSEKVGAQKLSMTMLLSDDVATAGWRLGVTESAALVQREGAGK